MENNPNMQHLGSERLIQELNFFRNSQNMNRLYVHRMIFYQNNLIFLLEDSTFLFVYNFESKQFLDREQKSIGNKIDSFISLGFSKVGNVPGEQLVLAYNKFNELQVKSTSCIGLISVASMFGGTNPFEIEVSEEVPISLFHVSESAIACVLDRTIQSAKGPSSSSVLRVYSLVSIKESELERLASSLPQAMLDTPVSERISAVNSFQAFVLWGTERGNVGMIDAASGGITHLGEMIRDEILYLSVIELGGAPQFLLVGRTGKVVVRNREQQVFALEFPQRVEKATSVRVKEGLTKQAIC